MTATKLRNTRIALVVLGLLFVADIIGSYGIYEENQELKQQVGAYKASSTIYESQAKHWMEKCEHYQSANEALIKYAEPKSLNKAVKATPLPRLIEV